LGPKPVKRIFLLVRQRVAVGVFGRKMMSGAGADQHAAVAAEDGGLATGRVIEEDGCGFRRRPSLSRDLPAMRNSAELFGAALGK